MCSRAISWRFLLLASPSRMRCGSYNYKQQRLWIPTFAGMTKGKYQAYGNWTVKLKIHKIRNYNRLTLPVSLTPHVRQPCLQKFSVPDCSDSTPI